MGISDWLFEKFGMTLNYTPLAESEELVLALGVLIKLSESDGDSDPQEVAEMLRIAREGFSKNIEEGLSNLVKASQEFDGLSLEEGIKQLNEQLSSLQKKEFAKMAFRVARVDGVIAAGENQFLVKVMKGIGISEDVASSLYAEVLRDQSKR